MKIIKTRAQLLSVSVLLLIFSCKNEPLQAVPIRSLAETDSSEDIALPDFANGPHVWVCKSSGAKKFHLNRDCDGLGRCTNKIEKVSMADAKAVGLTQCSYNKCK